MEFWVSDGSILCLIDVTIPQGSIETNKAIRDHCLPKCLVPESTDILSPQRKTDQLRWTLGNHRGYDREVFVVPDLLIVATKVRNIIFQLVAVTRKKSGCIWSLVLRLRWQRTLTSQTDHFRFHGIQDRGIFGVPDHLIVATNVQNFIFRTMSCTRKKSESIRCLELWESCRGKKYFFSTAGPHLKPPTLKDHPLRVFSYWTE